MECAVRPPFSSNAARPEDAVARQMRPRERPAANARLKTKDLPVPPGPYRKKMRCKACHQKLGCVIVDAERMMPLKQE